jgi:hypothetical protein
MRIVLLTLLPLLFANLSFSQGAKVYLEGEQNTISTEISALEKRKTELTAAKREFITAKDLRGEYYDLSLKAMETGDAAYVDKAIQKLKDSKELLDKSFAKWNAYHIENRIPKSPLDEADYNNLLHTISNLLTEEKITAQKMGCCGPDIVEIHLVPQNVIEPSNIDTGKNDFWVTGANRETKQKTISTKNLLVTISGEQVDLGKFKYVAVANKIGNGNGVHFSFWGLAPAEIENNQLLDIILRGYRSYSWGTLEVINNTEINKVSKDISYQIFIPKIESSNPDYSSLEYPDRIEMDYFNYILSDLSIDKYVESELSKMVSNFVQKANNSGRLMLNAWDDDVYRELNNLYSQFKNDNRGLAYQEYITSSYNDYMKEKYTNIGQDIENYVEHIKAAYYLNLTFDFYKAFATIKRK